MEEGCNESYSKYIFYVSEIIQIQSGELAVSVSYTEIQVKQVNSKRFKSRDKDDFVSKNVIELLKEPN